ncbi:hypothetical protein DMA11_17000 [Marinilabiliaceae bacterium JC017]|nr:hypothetical protein DMA11_17000 [Marinilabiliaceae bacterium JC017]
MKTRKTIIWILGFLITITAAVYQRLTGPTHPFRTTVTLNEQGYKLKFIRSGETTPEDPAQPITLELPIADKTINALVSFRKFPTDAPYTTEPFERKGDVLIAQLPQQPAAGKVEYSVTLTDGSEKIKIPTQVIRFKDPVPTIWLAPHILTMFFAMFLANVTGLMALFNRGNYARMTILTSVFFAIGGLFLGPVVQKYAFGEFWTGVPFGWDLTDNKTLIAAIFWAIALFMNKQKPSRSWTLIASIVMLAVYAVPHSMFGSELDHETGKVIQGIILPYFG